MYNAEHAVCKNVRGVQRKITVLKLRHHIHVLGLQLQRLSLVALEVSMCTQRKQLVVKSTKQLPAIVQYCA